MQRIYFPKISGTQRKSIIEVRQVLSKYEHFAEFCPTLVEGHRENPRLWPRAKIAAVSLRQLAREEEACVRGIYIYAKKTIKFSYIGKDCFLCY